MKPFFDYFAFTLHVHTDNFDRALSVAQGLVASSLEDEGKEGAGMYWYSNTYRFDGGIIAYGGQYQKETIFVSITGSGCRHFTYDDFVFLLTSLSEFGEIIPKRFDLAVDVPGLSTYYQIRDDLKKFFISERVRKFSIYENFQRSEDGDFASRGQTGGTIYFGSRQSPRMTRVYMKHREDGQDVTRIEIEAKEGWAIEILKFILAGHDAPYIMVALSRDYINVSDFVTVNGSTVEMTYPRKERTKARAAWLLSVAGCVEDVRQVYGDQFVMDLVFAGFHKRGKSGAFPFSKTPVSNTGVQDSLFDYLNTQLDFAEVDFVS